MYRINALVKIARGWRQAAELKYVSASQLGQGNLALRDAKIRRRREKIHEDTMTVVGQTDAAYESQSSLGKCRLGNVIGLTSPNLCGPRHIIHWMSKLTRRLDKSNLGGEVYALSEMVDHMSMLRESSGHFVDLCPGMVGAQDCESLFALLKRKR